MTRDKPSLAGLPWPSFLLGRHSPATGTVNRCWAEANAQESSQKKRAGPEERAQLVK